MAAPEETIDPRQISDPSQIPPKGARAVGLSQGLVEVYYGTLLGDVDAQPSAKELLGSAPDTGGLANADYICNQVSALYGGPQLPTFKGPLGNNVKALVFVSGSRQGSYGAFHFNIPGDQADFDRIVVDSLDASGTYSAGSGLGFVMAAEGPPEGRTGLLTAHHGPADLLAIPHTRDPRLEGAKPAEIKYALTLASQSMRALMKTLETRDASARPGELRSRPAQEEPVQLLTRTNRDLQGLVRAAVGTTGVRQYLSTALFAAELVESFQVLTQNADPGKTDGEAVSRVVAYKLTPEISLIPGFNSVVVQQWWHDSHPDFVNDNSQDDVSADGNGAGVIFLEFLNDYLGIPLDRIIQHMPTRGGAPLGETYVRLLHDDPSLADVAGRTGQAAFQRMIALLQELQNPDGTLNLPANGNPFPAMPGAKQGGLFASTGARGGAVSSGQLAQDTQGSLQLLTQLEQQVVALRAALQQVQQDVSTGPAAIGADERVHAVRAVADYKASYGPPLGASVVAKLEQQVTPYRAPQYDQALRNDFWPHVYNELPGTGPRTNRLQVITGTIPSPEAVQITGTIRSTRPEQDGDLHIAFQPDDPKFPINHDSAEPPLEIEIIYAGPVTQPDARQAGQGYTNPIDISPLKSGTRIQVAGPLIFDTAHGRVDSGGNVQYGLEIHPAVAVSVISGSPIPPPAPVPGDASMLSADLASTLSQASALAQTMGNFTALLQKMKGEAPAH